MIEQSGRPVTAGGGNYNPRQGNNNIYNQSNNGQIYDQSNQQDIDSQMMFQQYEQPFNFGQRTGSAKSFKPHYQSKMGGVKPKGIRAQTAQQQNRVFQQVEPGKKGIPLQQQADLFKRNQELFDKEKLFEDLQHAKGMINQINEENQRLKTKNVNLEREINKQSKLIEELQHAGQGGKKNKFQNDTFLITSLKRQVKDLQQEVSYKTQEIDKLKKNIKYTKFSEIEIEKKAFADETLRLRKISEQLLQENGMFENQNEKIVELEERCLLLNNLVGTLNKDNTEMANAIRTLEEKSLTDQQQAKKQDQKFKDQRRQIANMKKQITEKDEQIRSLRNIQQYSIQNQYNANKKRPLNTQNQNQQQSEQRNYNNHQNQIEVQQQHSNKQPNLQTNQQNQNQTQQNQQNLEEQQKQQQQMQHQQQQIQQNQEQNHQQGQQQNDEKQNQQEQQDQLTEQQQQEQNQEQEKEQEQEQEQEQEPQEIFNSPVKQDDIKYFTDYVRIKLQLNDFNSNEIKSHLSSNLPKESNKYNRTNIAQLKEYFKEHPYQLDKCPTLELYCRYLVEPKDQEEILYDQDKYANLSVIQNQIFKDFQFKSQTNEDKNKNFEFIQYILKNKMELIKTCIEQVSGQKDWFQYLDLNEAFKKASITFNQEQIDYILSKIINFNDQKQNEECLKNLKLNDLFAAFSVQMEKPSRNKRPISSRGRRTSEQGPKSLINNQSPLNKAQIQKQNINDYLDEDEKIEDDDGDYDDDFDYYGETRVPEQKPRITSQNNTQDLKKPSNMTQQSKSSQNYGDEGFESEDNINKQQKQDQQQQIQNSNQKKTSSLSNRVKQKASSRNKNQQQDDNDDQEYEQDYEQEQENDDDDNYGDDFEDPNNNNTAQDGRQNYY